MKLGEAQEQFARLLPMLFNRILFMGFEMRLGDLYRDPRVHGNWGEDVGYSHPKSNHKLKLAIDINLFRSGQFLKDTKDHLEIGEFWETLHPHCRWGGRWDDGNHYEFTQEPWR